MATPEITLSALKEERIHNPEDLFEFLKDDLNSVFESLRKPPVKVVNNKVVAVAPHIISENSRKHIAVAAKVTRYYAQIGRDITRINMHWKTLTTFDIPYNTLKDLNNQDDPEVLNITKKGSKIKWIESLKLNLNAIVDICNCLLVYAVHEQHDSSGVACGTLISDQPHSEEHGLVEVEMIILTSHDHLLFRNYNGEAYGRMERAPSGLQYASTIVRFRKKQ